MNRHSKDFQEYMEFLYEDGVNEFTSDQDESFYRMSEEEFLDRLNRAKDIAKEMKL